MKLALQLLVASLLLPGVEALSQHKLTLNPAVKNVLSVVEDTPWARARKVATAALADAGGDTNCSSPLVAWYETKTEELGLENAAALEPYQFLPFFYRHCISQDQDEDYIGMNGKYTNILFTNHELTKAFWNAHTDDILLLGVHGTVFQDKDKLIPTLKFMFQISDSEASKTADEIQEVISGIPDQYNNPLLTADAFAMPAGGIFSSLCIATSNGSLSQNAILMGDGLLSAAEDVGLAGEECAALLHAHEFGHQMQYEMRASPLESVSRVPITVEIQLDSEAGQIGWMITDVQTLTTYAIRPVGSLAAAVGALVTETIYVDANRECEFTISDTVGNGLGNDGYYRLIFGVDTDSTSNVLVRGDGQFGFLRVETFYSGSLQHANRRKELMADAMSSYFLAHNQGANMDLESLSKVHDGFYAAGDCFDNEHARGTPLQKKCTSIWAASRATNDPDTILCPKKFRFRFDKELPKILELDEDTCPPELLESQPDVSALPLDNSSVLHSCDIGAIGYAALLLVMMFVV